MHTAGASELDHGARAGAAAEALWPSGVGSTLCNPASSRPQPAPEPPILVKIRASSRLSLRKIMPRRSMTTLRSASPLGSSSFQTLLLQLCTVSGLDLGGTAITMGRPLVIPGTFGDDPKQSQRAFPRGSWGSTSQASNGSRTPQGQAPARAGNGGRHF